MDTVTVLIGIMILLTLWIGILYKRMIRLQEQTLGMLRIADGLMKLIKEHHDILTDHNFALKTAYDVLKAIAEVGKNKEGRTKVN